MKLMDINLYKEDVRKVATLDLNWNYLRNKSIMISGATGMIGSFMIDILMHKNREENLNCTIFALTRKEKKAKQRFEHYLNSVLLRIIECDINKEFNLDKEKIDVIVHAASNTHPLAYSTQPIETIMTNIIGTKNLLDIAVKSNTNKFVFVSTVEIYGENKGDIESFTEDYCGYIDCNTLRAGYPESKRAGEALCQAYISEKNLNVVIPRLSRVFGPTMLMSDTKALSQFIKKGVNNENIILKSNGSQFYSYTYVADAVAGIFKCLFNGVCGEAYNISDTDFDITLKELANIIANYSNTEVVFEIPDSIESAGYSKATKAILDSSKLRELGWKAEYNIKDSLIRTIEIIKKLNT